jgi:hypothetical protein
VVRPILLTLLFAVAVRADDTLQWTGFALLRGSSNIESGPLAHDSISSQFQLGLDWSPAPIVSAHVHLLARSDSDGPRGRVGVPEAYLELNLHRGEDRLRLRGGAFFLPTSRENVDALWENPYAITSSALNSWLGEELRPLGIDASYFRRRIFAGATLFRGNDTFGAIPPVRGWTLDDHWTLLGEWVPVDADYFTSVSAENDGRLGWSARGGWNGDNLLVQLTHIDNRSDGEEYGRLFNWGTYFDIAGAEYTAGDWTVAAEYGWGPTFLVVNGNRFTNDLDAGYLLVSKQWRRVRTTVRLDSFTVDDLTRNAVTLAAFWTPRGSKVRLGGELTAIGGEKRGLIEVRYRLR